MPSTIVLAGIALMVIAILFLIAIVQNSVDERSIIATPTIPRQNGVVSSFASSSIKATSDEVFRVILNFKDYSTWSPFSEYKWKNVTADGVPMTGSPGSFKLSIDGFPTRTLPVKLSMLDREKKIIAELTTGYPPWLLGSERVQEVVPVEGQPGYCEYRTYHTIEGIGAYYLLLTAKEELREIQQRCADDLKAFIENGKR